MFDILPIKGGISAVEGFYCDGVAAGLKKNGKLDVAFIHSDGVCGIEAIFTSNLFKAAPIVHFLESNIQESNFILINTKNANAMTGERGLNDVKEILGALCGKFPHIKNPIMASTGVIGEYLPKEVIIQAFDKFRLDSKNHANAANAILTTDRFPKEIALRVDTQNGSFHIGAMAKGAGMIEPSMATMLCFIVTDADIPRDNMKELLVSSARDSFNAISVDGDTSTNDSLFLWANRKSKIYDKEAFKEALKIITKKLAIDIVSDGEGSSKVVCFHVKNASSAHEAQTCAKALANSLLVKTALFGGDPNWGRIASTIGSCGILADSKKLKISIGDCILFECEKIYEQNVQKAEKIMQEAQFNITCDLGMCENESHSFRAYGCDLGHKYVEINSDYRT